MLARSRAGGGVRFRGLFLCALRPPTQPPSPLREHIDAGREPPRIYMPPTRESGHGRYSSERGPLDFPAPMNSRQDIFVRCRGLLAPVRCALWIAKIAPLNPTWPQFSATRPPIRYAPATGRARRETPSLRSGDSRLALIPPLNASRRSVSPLRLPPLYGESGVRTLRARAFLCGVGGCSPPSAWRGGCGSRSPSHRPSP